MRERAILLTHCSQLLTLRGNLAPRRGGAMRELGIIEDGAVLIENGKIAAVGSTDEPWVRGKDVDEIDCRDKVALPGFVDSHTHPVFAAPRLIDFEKRIAGASYEEIAEAGGGIRSSIRGVREASMNNSLLRSQPASTRCLLTAPRLSKPNRAMASALTAKSNRLKRSAVLPDIGVARL